MANSPTCPSSCLEDLPNSIRLLDRPNSSMNTISCALLGLVVAVWTDGGGSQHVADATRRPRCRRWARITRRSKHQNLIETMLLGNSVDPRLPTSGQRRGSSGSSQCWNERKNLSTVRQPATRRCQAGGMEETSAWNASHSAHFSQSLSRCHETARVPGVPRALHHAARAFHLGPTAQHGLRSFESSTHTAVIRH